MNETAKKELFYNVCRGITSCFDTLKNEKVETKHYELLAHIGLILDSLDTLMGDDVLYKSMCMLYDSYVDKTIKEDSGASMAVYLGTKTLMAETMTLMCHIDYEKQYKIETDREEAVCDQNSEPVHLATDEPEITYSNHLDFNNF